MSLRIALTHAFSWPEVRRGGERYLHELAAALARRGHRVHVLAGATARSSEVMEGVRVTRIPRGPSLDRSATERFARRLLPQLVARRFDVVHSLGPRDAVASLRARRLHRGRRTAYTNLGNPVREWWDAQPDRTEHERVVREIDVYACLSAFGLRSLLDDYGREGTLLPGGVRMSAFRPAAPRASEPTILYSGALDEPRKGIDVLLAAIALVAEREPRVRLWLSGQGDANALLEAAPAEVRSRTVVLPLASPLELSERYSAAWVTALPSVGEAFGLVLVESLACGTPIVGCDHSSLPELVRPGIGALARPKDARSLADACLEAIHLAAEPDVVERCRDAARPYDWDDVIAPAVERSYLS